MPSRNVCPSCRSPMPTHWSEGRYCPNGCKPGTDLTIGTVSLGLAIGLIGWWVIFSYFGIL